MIRTPTTLVLGAGASAPYGFPVGSQLNRLILNLFEPRRASPALAVFGQYNANDIFEFIEAFRKSGQASIDAFLEHRPEFLAVGKLAIAYCLIPYEDEDKLFAVEREGDTGGDWYRYLFNKMADGPFEEFGNNRISIVTFNYDRSLEHYLLTALENSYGRTREQCSEQLKQLPIVHVYGQLSSETYLGPGSRIYDPTLTRDAVEHAAYGITLLHERTQVAAAAELLTNAERICFLGFGFDEINVRRLTIERAESQRAKPIFGTARGLIGREIEQAATRIKEALKSTPTLASSDNLQMLRERLVLR